MCLQLTTFLSIANLFYGWRHFCLFKGQSTFCCMLATLQSHPVDRVASSRASKVSATGNDYLRSSLLKKKPLFERVQQIPKRITMVCKRIKQSLDNCILDPNGYDVHNENDREGNNLAALERDYRNFNAFMFFTSTVASTCAALTINKVFLVLLLFSGMRYHKKLNHHPIYDVTRPTIANVGDFATEPQEIDGVLGIKHYAGATVGHNEHRNVEIMEFYCSIAKKLDSPFVKTPLEISSPSSMVVAQTNLNFERTLNFELIIGVAEAILGATVALSELPAPYYLRPSELTLNDFYRDENTIQLIFRPSIIYPVIEGNDYYKAYGSYSTLATILVKFVELMDPCSDFDLKRYSYKKQDLEDWTIKIQDIGELYTEKMANNELNAKESIELQKSLKMAQMLHLIMWIRQDNREELSVDLVKQHWFFQ